MTKAAAAKRDWLEPPAWWKKWRPLRWVAGGLVLVAIASWIRPMLDASEPGEAENGDAPAQVAAVAPAIDAPAVETEVFPIPAEYADAASAPAADPSGVKQDSTAQKTAAASKTAPAKDNTASAKPAAAVDKTKPTPAAPAPDKVVATATPATTKTAPAPPTKTEAKAPPPKVEEAPARNAGNEETEVATLPSPESRAYRDYTAMVPDPVALLIGAFKSYISVDAAHDVLLAAKAEPVHESNHSKVPSGVPPRNLDLLRVKVYRHLGIEGTLELQFFNDRLYQAEFEPTDAEAYRAALRKALPQLKQERSGRSELREGQLRVASSLDLAVSEVGAALRTRPFVLWQDLRLVRQRDAWDQQYATRAAP